MEDVSIWMEEFSETAARLFGQAIAFVPDLVGAVLLILVGWLLARLLRSAATRIFVWFNALVERTLGRGKARYLRLPTAAVELLGNVVFWIIVLLFVTAATRVLGLLAFSDWLDSVVGYLPALIAGALIMLVGIAISALVRDLITTATASVGLTYGNLFGRAAQIVVLATALLIGIAQVGIDVTLLILLVSILFAAVSAAFALAFALGARTFVSNLIGAHYARKYYRPGQRARLGDIEGEILELTPSGIIMTAENGRVVVPAKVFHEQATLLIAEHSSDD